MRKINDKYLVNTKKYTNNKEKYDVVANIIVSQPGKTINDYYQMVKDHSAFAGKSDRSVKRYFYELDKTVKGLKDLISVKGHELSTKKFKDLFVEDDPTKNGDHIVQDKAAEEDVKVEADSITVDNAKVDEDTQVDGVTAHDLYQAVKFLKDAQDFILQVFKNDDPRPALPLNFAKDIYATYAVGSNNDARKDLLTNYMLRDTAVHEIEQELSKAYDKEYHFAKDIKTDFSDISQKFAGALLMLDALVHKTTDEKEVTENIDKLIKALKATRNQDPSMLDTIKNFPQTHNEYRAKEAFNEALGTAEIWIQADKDSKAPGTDQVESVKGPKGKAATLAEAKAVEDKAVTATDTKTGTETKVTEEEINTNLKKVEAQAAVAHKQAEEAQAKVAKKPQGFMHKLLHIFHK